MRFTESHLRRVIASTQSKWMAFHLEGGSVVSGKVLAIDIEQDGYINATLRNDSREFHFAAPVDQIIAYEAEIAAK